MSTWPWEEPFRERREAMGEASGFPKQCLQAVLDLGKKDVSSLLLVGKLM